MTNLCGVRAKYGLQRELHKAHYFIFSFISKRIRNFF